ncbi:MAG: PPC domain-containing DNA-binding protein [Halanaerobiales bacterium]|nr:PPC domain-containing DNA-binding protein [Halanaerobiales bacterium]
MLKKYDIDQVYMGRLDKDDDLLEKLTEVINENEIDTGVIKVIGAVQNAKIGFYNQDTNQYEYMTFDREMEIVSCIGNISYLEGERFIHAHIVLADEDGSCYGGHLAEGTKVFASEFYIQSLKGDKLTRTHDDKTQLTLW